ncbi:MAG: DNA mismatch repair endonuclease MutL [Bacteroidales bacterium]|nr:DNA mismatch repair endonuclease MutL [Bacteroidales bacterium]
MSDIIKLLPDSVANQIAAGEVIQRPASVVKELMENAIDAGASTVKVNIKEAGRTLIQVIDNGCGMSQSDASLAFERYATSKISSAKDLFAIRTLGFRGEALASIAAIAEVDLKTRRVEDEVGTEIRIHGSELKGREPVSCPPGSNFMVRNLFYNVPARRKFLKANTTEFRHIVNEFYRVALTNPELSFSLAHNQTEIYSLPPSQIKQRIINIFGKNMSQVLIPVQAETSIVNIHGYLGKPEAARKRFGEQFFFVNRRYMRHPYFHKAIMKAYEQVLPPDTVPSYFLFMEAATESIDINIHPTKTEVKFEDERSIFQILHAAARETLGKHSMVPSLDFSKEGDIDIPVLRKDTEIKIPGERINPDYNPFEEEQVGQSYHAREQTGNQARYSHWESLFEDIEKAEQKISEPLKENVGAGADRSESNLFQFKQKYILLAVKSGLMVVNQQRAHERILYDRFLLAASQDRPSAQQELFPRKVELNAADHAVLIEIFDDICKLGFDIRDLGDHSVEIMGIPADLNDEDPSIWLDHFLKEFNEKGGDIRGERDRMIASALARTGAIKPGKVLMPREMREMLDQLFACGEPGFTPDGKTVFRILPLEDIDKFFN